MVAPVMLSLAYKYWRVCQLLLNLYYILLRTLYLLEYPSHVNNGWAVLHGKVSILHCNMGDLFPSQPGC